MSGVVGRTATAPSTSVIATGLPRSLKVHFIARSGF
jgi:hypothetical protein